LARLVSISPEYTKGDKILAWSVLIWTLFNLLVIFVQLICNLCFGVWSEKTWFNIWKYYNLPLGLLVGAVTTVWFTCGCTRDLYRLLKELKENYKKSQKE
jgi:SSS family solute:Na+ symporter